MKVINATFSKIYGGAEAVFLNYSKMLRSQGNEVISIVHPRAKIKASMDRDNLVSIRNFSRHDPFTKRALKKIIKSEQPDCIITHNHRTAYLFRQLKLEVPIIAVAHAVGRYGFDSDAVITVAEHMRQAIIQTGLAPELVRTIPNTFDCANSEIKKANQSQQVPVIGVCGRFVASKGIPVFIQALAILKQKGHLFHAKIAGEGREKRNYLRLIKHHQLQGFVDLIGWIEDKASFYQNLDLFCHPSLDEAFGLVILEAMAYGLPMVLTALPGPLEVLGDEKGAVFVAPGDPEAIATALERLMTDAALANKLSLIVQERVKIFSSERIAPQLHQALDDLCVSIKKQNAAAIALKK